MQKWPFDEILPAATAVYRLPVACGGRSLVAGVPITLYHLRPVLAKRDFKAVNYLTDGSQRGAVKAFHWTRKHCLVVSRAVAVASSVFATRRGHLTVAG